MGDALTTLEGNSRPRATYLAVTLCDMSRFQRVTTELNRRLSTNYRHTYLEIREDSFATSEWYELIIGTKLV